jgi:acyl-CoA synthetase (NDP forming)
MRPIPADGKPFSVEARLRHRSKSIIAVDAKVINSAGKTAQTCTSTLLVSR